MNKIKVAFFAVIAIAAMSFTLISKTEVKAEGAKLVANCYTLQQADPATCVWTTPQACSQTILNRPVRNIVIEPSALCGTGQNVFCCATLEVIPEPLCETQPLLTSFTDYLGVAQTNKYAKIRAIFCKP